MSLLKALRKFLWITASAGATLSTGFLSFVGMYLYAPYLFLSVLSFVLAMSYEIKVNGDSARRGSKRMFGRDYLKLGIAERYLDELIEEENDHSKPFVHANNLFYKNYKAQKKYVDDLRKDIFALQNLLHDCDKNLRAKIRLDIKKQKKELKIAKKECLTLKKFFVKKLYSPNPYHPNAMEKAVADLLGNQADALKKEIQQKAFFIKTSWILLLPAGGSSTLATLAAIKANMAAFALLSLVPGGVVMTLSIVAGMGYILLLYQNVSDMIQDYRRKWTGYFNKRNNESSNMHIVRVTVAVCAFVVACLATFALAGTWYKYVKDGAKIVGAIDKVASTIRDILLYPMLIPNMIFNVKNAIESINIIAKKNEPQKISNIYSDIKYAFHHENIFQFLNPFRLASETISLLGEKILRLGHVISIGFTSDQIYFPGMTSIPSSVPATANAINEYITDYAYLKDGISKILSVLFLPLTIAVAGLNVLSSLWDYTCSKQSLSDSFKKMFKSNKKKSTSIPTPPVAPVLSEEWHRQKIIETCDHEIDRIKNQNIQRLLKIKSAKATANNIAVFEEVKIGVNNGEALQRKLPKRYIERLAPRGIFSSKKPSSDMSTQSQETLKTSFISYHHRRLGA